jgi:hypothetical protein
VGGSAIGIGGAEPQVTDPWISIPHKTTFHSGEEENVRGPEEALFSARNEPQRD